MAVREFGVPTLDDNILFDIAGGLGQIGDIAFTAFLLVKPLSLNSGRCFVAPWDTAGGAGAFGLFDNAGGGGQLAAGDDITYITGVVGETASAWQLLYMSCAGPGSTCRFGRALPGGSWSRVNSSGTWAANGVDANRIELGSYKGGSFSSWRDMRLAVAALFSTNLDDTATDSILSAGTTQSILDLDPYWLVELNQASVNDTVRDRSGNNNHQTGINGTTVITGDDPTWEFLPPPTFSSLGRPDYSRFPKAPLVRSNP